MLCIEMSKRLELFTFPCLLNGLLGISAGKLLMPMPLRARASVVVLASHSLLNASVYAKKRVKLLDDHPSKLLYTSLTQYAGYGLVN